MSERVIPYERFLEIRQRRKQLAEEMTSQPGSAPNGDSHDGVLPTIDCEAVPDTQPSTLGPGAVVVRQIGPSV